MSRGTEGAGGGRGRGAADLVDGHGSGCCEGRDPLPSSRVSAIPLVTIG